MRIERPGGTTAGLVPDRPAWIVACEHAGRHVPAALGTLGLDPADLERHIAWDIGALDLARAIAAGLGAPLVAQHTSRLVYDCNRPPDASDAIPLCSEDTPIPGNRNLDATARRSRVVEHYEPFREAVRDLLDEAERAGGEPVALVTVHTFTPVYAGARRDVEIGVLADADTRLAEAVADHGPLRAAFDVRRDEPYDAADGVTHTLREHAVARGLPNVMIEVRNDLLEQPDAARRMGDFLCAALQAGLADVRAGTPREHGLETRPRPGGDPGPRPGPSLSPSNSPNPGADASPAALPAALRGYVRVVERFNRAVGRAVMWGIFAMMGVLLWSTFTKNAPGFLPSLWTLEIAQFMMMGYFVLGGPYAVQLGAHVRMDLLYGRWSARRQAGMDVATVLFLLTYLGFLLYGGVSSTSYALEYAERSYSAWRPYMAPIKIALCVGIVLMILQVLATLVRNVAAARGAPLPDPLQQRGETA